MHFGLQTHTYQCSAKTCRPDLNEVLVLPKLLWPHQLDTPFSLKGAGHISTAASRDRAAHQQGCTLAEPRLTNIQLQCRSQTHECFSSCWKTGCGKRNHCRITYRHRLPWLAALTSTAAVFLVAARGCPRHLPDCSSSVPNKVNSHLK